MMVGIAILVAVLAVVGVWAYRTANRLDRLHVRYDLSWQALDGALARRAVVARAVAIDAYGGASEGAGWRRWPTPPRPRPGPPARRARTSCRPRWPPSTRRRCRPG
ncbi:hydrolase, nudix family domain protein [Mycobacterium sp. MAC_080597_8934]|nr:hydrolase, nudix family domain protein [Mycobacterium sp. MAC_080597_8934]